jgi:mono/diheme cytochrome c family protein
MTRRALAFLISLFIFIPAAAAIAEPMTFELPEETAAFKPGPGVDIATARCRTCHSVDYISIQPPNKGKAFWEAEVQKMIKVYKAQIDPSDAQAIADYLAATY